MDNVELQSFFINFLYRIINLFQIDFAGEVASAFKELKSQREIVATTQVLLHKCC